MIRIYKSVIFSISIFLILYCPGLLALSTDNDVSINSRDSIYQIRIDDLPKAIALIRQNKFSVAKQILSNLINRNQDNAEAHYWLAIAYSQTGEQGKALKHIAESEKRASHNRQVALEHARMLVNSGKYKEAEKKYQEILSQVQEKTEIRKIKRSLYILKGQQLINAHKLEEALKHYEAMLQMYPNEVLVMEALGYIYSKLEFWEEAEHYYITASLLAPDRVLIYRRMANMYEKMGDQEQKRFYYQKVMQIDPSGVNAKIVIQNLLRQGKEALYSGNIDDAFYEYLTILKVQPDNMIAKLSLAEAYEYIKDWEGAEKIYLELLEKHPTNLSVLSRLANVYFVMEDTDQAIESYQQIVDVTADSAIGRDATAKLNMLYVRKAQYLASHLETEKDQQSAYLAIQNWIELGRLDNAQWLANSIASQYPDNAIALYWLGILHEKRGELSMALFHLSKSMWRNPQDANTRLAYARVLSRTGELEKAEATYRDVIAQIKDQSKRQQAKKALGLVIAEQLVRKGKPRAAITQYRKMLKGNERDLSVIKRIANIYASMGDLENANNLLEEIKNIQIALKQEKELLSKGKMLVQQKKYTDAEHYLNRSLKLNPQNSQALYWIGYIYVQRGDLHNAIQFYNKSIKYAPANTTLRIEYAKLLVATGQLVAAEQQYAQILSITPNKSERKKIKYLSGFVKGQLLINKQSYDLALHHFQTMSIIYPQDENVLQVLAGMYQKLNFYEEAKEIYQSILARNSNSADSHIQLASIAVYEGNSEQRLIHLAQALQLDPSGKYGQLAEKMLLEKGREYIRHKNYIGAERELKTIINVHASHLAANLAMAEIYEATSLINKAENLYLKVLALNPVDLTARKKLAELYIRTDKLDDALREYQKIYDIAPSTTLGQIANAKLNFLYGRQSEKISKTLYTPADQKNAVSIAELWMEKNRLDAAQWLLNAVIEKNAQIPEAYFNLAMIHKQRGELHTSLEYLSKGVKLLPGNTDYALEFANLLARVGKTRSAEKVYLQVIASLENDTVKQREAKRQYGFLTGQRLTNNKRYRSALRHYVKMEHDYINDTEVMAKLAGVLIKVGRYQDAENLYNKALKIEPNNRVINVALAQLYKKRGNNKAYLKQLRQAFLLDPYAGLGEQLATDLGLRDGIRQLQKQHWNAAVVAFNRVLEANPNNVFAQVGISAAYMDSGYTNEAEKTLKKVINLENSHLDTRLNFLFLKASYALDQ